MICPVYIAEISPEKWRGRLGALFQLGVVVGIFVTLFINLQIQGMGDGAWNTAWGWRWMLGAEVAPAALLLFILFTVPESPRWLFQQGRLDEAHAVLQRIGGKAHAASELKAMRAMHAENAHRAAAPRGEGRLGELLDPCYRRPLLVAIFLMMFSQFSGINAIMYYSTKIFTTAGVGVRDSFSSSVWIGLVNILFTLVAIALVDRAGRRPLLLVGTAVQTVALGFAGWMFYGGQHGLALLGCIIAFIGAFSVAMGPIPWIFCSEIFPTRIRGRAMSIATFTIWLSCFIVAQTFPMLNDSPAVGPALTFWIYAGCSLGSFIFVLARVPETKGRKLEDIEAAWQRDCRTLP
jgi:SP family arabinose:H+ symporter-like MFS transporter